MHTCLVRRSKEDTIKRLLQISLKQIKYSYGKQQRRMSLLVLSVQLQGALFYGGRWPDRTRDASMGGEISYHLPYISFYGPS